MKKNITPTKLVIMGTVVILIFAAILGATSTYTGGSNGTLSNTIEIDHMTDRKPNITVYNSPYWNRVQMNDNNFHYITDDDTDVVYLFYESDNGVTITPLYNQDGTLRTKKQLELN